MEESLRKGPCTQRPDPSRPLVGGLGEGRVLEDHDLHPWDGYRRLTFMMLDEDVVAASPATVYRVLKANRRLDRHKFSPSKKGTGFVQPLKPHEHWHIDVSYINVEGTFYDLTSVLDGCSRAILHWELSSPLKTSAIGNPTRQRGTKTSAIGNPTRQRGTKTSAIGNPTRQRGTKTSENRDSNPSLTRRVPFFNGLLVS